jgi:hypothetical protein
MKLNPTLLIAAAFVGTSAALTSCQTKGDLSGTHEMGGPRTPRMDNSVMPDRGPVQPTSGGDVGATHEMGGPRTPRMTNSSMQ